MERAIKLAIEGGYDSDNTKFAIKPWDDGNGPLAEVMTKLARHEWLHPRIWSDPLFWQALGKVLPIQYSNPNGTGYVGANGRVISWKELWHRFIDHLADGKDPQSFFEELLKGKEE